MNVRPQGAWLIPASVALVAGCSGRSSGTPQRVDPFAEAERQAQVAYLAQPIALSGTVLAGDGSALAGATVRFGAATTTTAFDGSFAFSGLERRNGVVQISAREFRDETLAVFLQQDAGVVTVPLSPVRLLPVSATTARMIFGGDVSFGRRFLDPAFDELVPTPASPRVDTGIPPSNPAALIDSANPLPGSVSTVQWIRPHFLEADFASVNLETPITDTPDTPHPLKKFAFFSLPASLGALDDLGVDYVGLGNNHVFDQLQNGMEETLFNLDAAGVPYSGAGLNLSDAYLPHRRSLATREYSFLALTTIDGRNHFPDDEDLWFVATPRTSPPKGGAADITSRSLSAATSAIAAEASAGRFPIVQLQTGTEYTFEPTPFAAGRHQAAADAGGVLIVGHHPHVAQGFAMLRSSDARDVLSVDCTGNLIFDQSRLETMLSYAVRIDQDGPTTRAARAIPQYLEDFRPHLIAGRLADTFLRRIGEFSRNGLIVYPYNGQGIARLAIGEAVAQSRSVTHTVQITDPTRPVVVDLRDIASSDESLAFVQADQPGLSVHAGRDLMVHGDFEDYDTDDVRLEAARWDVTGTSRFVCVTGAFRGVAGLCSTRRAGDSDASITPFRNSIRVMGDALDLPQKDLSVFGYLRGQGAGPIQVVARYVSSEDSNVIGGDEVAFTHAGGDFAWRAFAAPLNMPADTTTDPVLSPTVNARAVRIFLHHRPPTVGAGMVSFDDLAVVGWEQLLDSSAGAALTTPHALDFLRIRGPVGTYQFTLTLERYRPS